MAFSKENLPKTKDDWNALKSEDMELWSELTQDSIDRTIREKRELETKFKDTEAKVSNLSAELEKHRKNAPAGSGIYVPVIEPVKPYTRDNLPKTDKEWEELSIKEPLKFTDLRTYRNTIVQQQEQNFWETRSKAQKTLQEEHPDMFEAELDESNQPKLDDKGKVILKVDKNGDRILDLKSEKGKLFDQLYNANPRIAEHANAPELLQAQMERELRLKGTQIVNQVQSEREKLFQEGQVIADGLTPPQAVKVTFHSEEEKVHAQRMISKGLYKDFTEYVRNRDKRDDGIYDEGRTPVFTKK